MIVLKPYGLMADLHLHPWSAFSRTLEGGLNSRLVALLGEIERCAAEVSAAGGDTVVMAGDVFHVRGSVQPTVLNATRDKLNFIGGKHGVEFLIMPGNHDLEGKDSTRLSSAVTALESPFCKIISAPTYFKELRTVLVPWVESIPDLEAVIDKLGTGDMPKFLCENTDLIIHAPIDGVIKGLPAHGLTAEKLAALGYHRVFAGHYHNHKRFTGNVFSIGALAHHTWSDVGTKAGYLIVRPEQVEWRKSHLPEFVDLSQLTELEHDEIPLLVDRNFVRVKVEADKVKDVEAARQELLDMGALAVIVQAEPKPPARDGAGTAPTKAAGASLEVSVADFIKKMYAASESDKMQTAVQKASMDVLASIDASGE